MSETTFSASSAVQSILGLAENQLMQLWGVRPHLTITQRFDSPRLVVRCNTDLDSPQSIILKQLTEESSEGINPTKRFTNECATLQFLTGLQQQDEFAPRLILTNPEARLMILADLGDHPTLQDLLFIEHNRSVEERFIAWGIYYAQMQTATRHKEADYLAIQHQLNAVSPLSDATLDVRGKFTEFQACMTALHVEPHPDFYTEVSAIEAIVHDDSPFRALCHCDAGPHNLLCMEKRVTMLDFEFAHFQNGLMDVITARIGFPQSYHGRNSPSHAFRAMEMAYRTELAKSLPEAADDRLFNAALAASCAHWGLGYIVGLWRVYLKARLEQGADYDLQRSDKGIPLYRKVANYLRVFMALSDELELFPAIRITLEAVVNAFEIHLGKLDPLPLYPAFE